MEQVVSNLVMNALEAAPQNTAIGVEADMRNNHLALTIRDDGAGMDEDVKRQIFNPFFSTKTTGTGLGLAIVQRIVHQHEGKIEVESFPGKGTAFTILL
jgi:signal transduction histidine kinase